jgi:hypothetical protein
MTFVVACKSTGSDPQSEEAVDAGLAGPDPDAMPDAPVDVCDPSLPRIDLKVDCQAVGDGITNDTAAFQKAAMLLANGGELTIPPGIYIVGIQDEKTDPDAPGAFYTPQAIFTVEGASCLAIRGTGATVKVASGLHFGGFDTSGNPKDVSGRIQSEAAHVGRVIELTDCENVWVEGLELDGNCSELILGGQWGDVDRQTIATGLSFNRCSNVNVVDVRTHHHGLDGVTVRHTESKPTAPKPHTFTRVISEYNGRQGLSWIGGWGLECIDCKFNHTGRAPNGNDVLASKPGAGVDIEPNAGTQDITRGGVFRNCEFADNVGAGMVTAGGDTGFATFIDCVFWGTTSYAAWPAHRGLAFESCRFHGTVPRASNGSAPGSTTPDATLATAFTKCTFEDVSPDPADPRVFRSGYLYSIPVGRGEGVSFTECEFINHNVRSVYIDDASTRELFDRCTFTFANPALTNLSQQATLRGCRLTACTFEESAAVTASGRTFYIEVSQVVVAASVPPTRVIAQRVHWSSTSGATGDIAPGVYT